MKEKVKQFLKDGRGAIVAIFILELILFMFITPNKYDDAFFLEKVAQGNIIDFVSERYNIWTSRVIIEFTLLTVLKTSKYLWILIQASMMALIGYSISKLFVKPEHKKEMNIMIIFLVLAYPITMMASAGWAATTINYMWPLATTLYCLIPIKKVWNGEKFKLFEYPLFLLSLLFACNQEQTCAIVCGSYVLFALLFFIKDKKIHPFIVMQLIISIMSLIFILTTPGNYIRKNEEIINNFKDFEMLTIQDKISLGLTTTLSDIIESNSIPFTILSLMIVAYIFLTYKENLYRIVALIPFASICSLGIFSKITFVMFPYLGSLTGILTKQEVILTAANCNNLAYTIPVILSMIVFISLILNILLIFKNLKNNIAVLVFLVGLASRLIMGFSPTVFASAMRTNLFLDFSMLITTLLIWQEFKKKTDKNEKKVQRRIYFTIKILAIFQYANALVGILLTQK